MSSLYARVFLKILDSSIAEDFTLRHVFEDFLKLRDYKTGIVDITRDALSRRLNIPLDVLNEKIKVLESPDPKSRPDGHDGRRLLRLDESRDWGWVIANHEKYERDSLRGANAERVAQTRNKNQLDDAEKKEFETFWHLYPRKNSKVDAERAFKKARQKVELQVLLDAVTAQRKSDQWTKDGGQFVPYASTWLNQERWNDQVTVEVGAKRIGPSLQQVQSYAKEKWGDHPDHIKWANGFHQFWAAQGWKKKTGISIADDWKIVFTEQTTKYRK